MKRYVFLVVAILFSICIYIQAQTNDDPKEEKLNRSHPENFIASNRKKMAQEEMGKIYKMLIEIYGTDSKRISSLKNAQTAWEKYRDLELTSEVMDNYAGGWPASTAFAWRKAELTEQRISRMKIILREVYVRKNAYYDSKKQAQKIKDLLIDIEKLEAANKKKLEDLEKKIGIKAEEFIEPQIQW